MIFTSYIGSYLPSGERLHVVEINVQDEDTHDVGSQILLALACIHLSTPVTVLWWWWEWNRICIAHEDLLGRNVLLLTSFLLP